MQKGILIGNLTRDPELRVTNAGKKVTIINIGVNISKEKSIFWDLLIWEKKIEEFQNVLNFLKKGARIHAICTILEPHLYQGKDNIYRCKLKALPSDLKILNAPKIEAPAPAAVPKKEEDGVFSMEEVDVIGDLF